MGLFGSKPLPATSYGYTPPPNATANGAMCSNFDCGAGVDTTPRRWPATCAQCGSPMDATFNPPWYRDARGVELEYRISHGQDEFGYYQSQLFSWRQAGAIDSGNSAAASQARADARAFASGSSAPSPLGFMFLPLVSQSLKAGDVDAGAEDLAFWIERSSTDDIATSHTTQTNSKQIIAATQEFFATAGAARHPLAPQIQRACVIVGRAANDYINSPMENFIESLAQMRI